MIGPQGMQPMKPSAAGPQALQGGLGDLAHALMLAKMRQGKNPMVAGGNFSPNAAAGSQMSPLMPTPSPVVPDMSGGGGGGANV
jgi:hypothetical protein